MKADHREVCAMGKAAVEDQGYYINYMIFTYDGVLTAVIINSDIAFGGGLVVRTEWRCAAGSACVVNEKRPHECGAAKGLMGV